MRVSLIVLFLFVCAATGCGAPGAPLPPSLGIPKPVNDLKVVRKGDTATLNWTAPSETTDGELIRKPGKMLVSRSLSGGAATTQLQQITQMTFPPSLKQDQSANEEFKDQVEPLLSSGADFAFYRVVSQSGTGRAAGSSNLVSVPLVPVAAAPAHVSAMPVPEGISISWDQGWPPQNQSHLTVEYAYRVMRREEGAKTPPATVKDVAASSQAMALVDTGIEWQKHYEYWIIPITSWQGGGKKGEVEGNDSPIVSVFANDIFPPAVPTGLEAVFSAAGQPSIDLSWTPDSEPDLAGYNVYRHRENEAPVKINSELVKSSAYRDIQLTPGSKYYYSVTAVDLRGNESAKSAEASETVPAQ